MAVPAWRFQGLIGDWLHANWHRATPVGPTAPQPDPARYQELSQALEAERHHLAKQYQAAKSPAARTEIERQARTALERALPAMMRCWLGTPWDFNGTAGQPGAGKIACGYFVATVLKDAGFKVDRYRLARQASGNILQSFLPKDACVLAVGKPYPEFVADLGRREPGIYVIGLDTHVAFVVLTPGSFRFIHSSGAKPWCVVDESSTEAGVLQRSSWRMSGNLTANPAVLKRWLSGTKITVRGNE